MERTTIVASADQIPPCFDSGAGIGRRIWPRRRGVHYTAIGRPLHDGAEAKLKDSHSLVHHAVENRGIGSHYTHRTPAREKTDAKKSDAHRRLDKRTHHFTSACRRSDG